MFIIFFLANIVILATFYWSNVRRINHLARRARIHGSKMYKLGVSDGRTAIIKQMHKYYTAPTYPIRLEEYHDP